MQFFKRQEISLNLINEITYFSTFFFSQVLALSRAFSFAMMDFYSGWLARKCQIDQSCVPYNSLGNSRHPLFNIAHHASCK